MGSAAHKLDAEPRCAYCNGGEQPFELDDDGDLVCAPGRGCARGLRRRHAPVSATSILSGPAPATSSPDLCACGEPAEWQELRGGRLVGCCEECSPEGVPQ